MQTFSNINDNYPISIRLSTLFLINVALSYTRLNFVQMYFLYIKELKTWKFCNPYRQGKKETLI